MNYKSTTRFQLNMGLRVIVAALIILGVLAGCTDSSQPTGASQAITTSPTAGATSNAGAPTDKGQASPTSLSTANTGIASGPEQDILLQAQQDYIDGNYDKAIAGFTQVIQLNPNQSFYYLERAKAYQDKGDYDNALADYLHVTKMPTPTPDTGPFAHKTNIGVTYCRIGDIYYKKAQHKDAIANFSECFSMVGGSPTWYEERGDSYAALGERDKAIADYKNILDNEGKGTGVGSYQLDATTRQRVQQKLKSLGGSLN